MRLVRFLLPVALLAVVAGAPSLALAGKKAASSDEEKLPVIVATGIGEFDSVFLRAKDIHTTIDTQTTALKDAKKGVNKAAGVAEDEPLGTGLNALKSAANGQLSLDNSGSTPRVKAKSGAPNDVENSATAINKLADAAEGTLGVVKQLGPEAKQLATACVDFPAKLLKMEPSLVLQNSKKVGDDTKATAATPERIDRLGKAATEVFDSLKATFTE